MTPAAAARRLASPCLTGVFVLQLTNGEAYLEELEALRLAKAKAGAQSYKKKRKIKGEGLRDTQPWQ